MTSKFTAEQQAQALANVEAAIQRRQEFATRFGIRSNSFAGWGNDKCISRAGDTARDIQAGRASDKQIRYWLNH